MRIRGGIIETVAAGLLLGWAMVALSLLGSVVVFMFLGGLAWLAALAN